MSSTARRTLAVFLLGCGGALLCGCPHPIKAIRDLVAAPASPKRAG